MADAAQADMTQLNAELAVDEENSSEAEENNNLVFHGSQTSMATGIAMLAASVLTFMMGMTEFYFNEALAWTFGIWGALLLYSNLLDVYQKYEVTDDHLTVTNPLRPWDSKVVWEWDNVVRYEIVVKRHEAEIRDTVQRVYHDVPGEVAIEREDRTYDPALAREIIERAGLSPAAADNPTDLEDLPQGKAVYLWH